MSLTDEIYTQLKDGLWAGLDYDRLRLKYEKSKGPFYNALQMVLDDADAEITKLSSEMKGLKEKGENEKAKLNNLIDQQGKIANSIKTGQQESERLEGEKQAIKADIEAISAELEANVSLLNQAQELQKMAFDDEKLRRLSAVLIEIGTKQGQKPSEAIDRFFNDLQDYDTKVGFEREVQRLRTITETKQLEAENWQTRAEKLEREHTNLKEAIDAIQALYKQRVKPAQVVAWNNILTSIGGVDELEKGLGRYQSFQRILAAKKGEQQRADTKLLQAGAALKTLTEQKAETEASIKALRVSAVKEIESVSQVSVEKITGMAQAGSNSIRQVGEIGIGEIKEALSLTEQVSANSIGTLRQVGETALGELKEALSLVDQVYARALEAGKTVRQIEGKLQNGKKVRESTEALITRVEGGR